MMTEADRTHAKLFRADMECRIADANHPAYGAKMIYKGRTMKKGVQMGKFVISDPEQVSLRPLVAVLPSAMISEVEHEAMDVAIAERAAETARMQAMWQKQLAERLREKRAERARAEAWWAAQEPKVTRLSEDRRYAEVAVRAEPEERTRADGSTWFYEYEMRVTVYIRDDDMDARFAGEEPEDRVELNWSAMGSVGLEQAAAYERTIAYAGLIGRRLVVAPESVSVEVSDA